MTSWPQWGEGINDLVTIKSIEALVLKSGTKEEGV